MILFVFLRTLSLMSAGKISFRKIFLLIIPFFIVAFLGGLRSPNIGLSMAKMISYLLLIFAVLHFIPYMIRITEGKILLDIIKLSIVFFVIGLILRFVNPQVAYLVARYRGLMGNPNGLGIYSTLIFPLYFIYLSIYDDSKRIVYVAIVLCLVSTVLTGSRTSLGTILIFYLLYSFHKRSTLVTTGFYVMVLPAILVFLASGGLEFAISLFGLEEYLRVESLFTGTGRYLAWSLGLTQIAQNPFIGRGFAWEEIFFHDMADILVATEHQGGMHNSYLTFIMNNGYLGFIFFAIFLIYMMFRMRAPWFSFPFALAAILSSFFESWLNSSLNAFSIHFFIILMVLIEYPKLVKRQKKLLET
ncbi:MAG: O-antigen ligase family protein [Bacteroidia bacterium]|nr:O-antigen ligase family protein [Bacteroidia bacterium]